MISPEVLRRYPFFAFSSEAQLQKVAMLADEVSYRAGEAIFHSGNTGEALYLLLTGSIEMDYVVFDQINPENRKKFQVGDVNPEELFGLSAVIEPRKYTATAKAVSDSRVIQFDASGLIDISKEDPEFGYGFMAHIARVTMEKLGYARTQLIAAREQK